MPLVTFKQLRERARMTQEQLAYASGVHQTTVSQVETGKIRSPQYSTVAALARALNTNPETVAAAITESVLDAAAA